MSQELFVLGAVIMCIVFLMLALADAILGKNRRMSKRMKKLRQRMGDELPDLVIQHSLRLEEKSAAPGLDKLVKQLLPSTQVLNQRLARAGLEIGLGSFLGLSAVAGLVAGGVFYFVMHLSLMVSLLGVIGVSVGGAHFLIDILIARRMAAFTNNFPDAIDLIVRAVKSGLPVTEGISIVGSEMEGPVSAEFKRISENMKIGQTMEDSLWETAKKLENAEFNFFVISLVVQAETGGNLAETLSNLGDILRQRQTMKLKINALASEARASAYILGCLPFVMVVILEVLSPGYTQPLYTDDTGIAMSIGALISIGIGVLVMFKMVRFEI